jgi:hypothetical protein
VKITIERDDGSFREYTFQKHHQDKYEGEGIILSLKCGEGLMDRAICYDAKTSEVKPKLIKTKVKKESPND